MNYPIKHSLSLGALLFTLWLGLSGKLNIIMLTLGVFSVLVIVIIANRMDSIDGEKYPARISILLFRFWLFLAREIILANIDVIKRIFIPGVTISPQLFELPQRHKSDLSRVIYANAITMTPGTVSMDINNESITIHSLTAEAARDLCSGRLASAVPEDNKDD